MKRFFVLAAVALAVAPMVGCEYDDDDLWSKVDQMQEQIDQNTEDIATLTALMDALSEGKVITSVEPTDEGYTLHFSDGSSIAIRNGRDGEDGQDGEDGKDGEDGTSGDSLFASVEIGDGVVIITLTDGRVIVLPTVSEEPAVEVRTLTFEDSDYKGGVSATYWSDFIPADSEYGNGNGHYAWVDEGNTMLAFTPAPDALFPGYGGHALSHYVGSDLAEGDYTHDLQAYNVAGGANGSENFCVHFGFVDDSGLGMMNEMLGFYFADGVARTIESMMVTNTTYVYNLLANGDGWQVPTGASDESWFKIVAYGFDENDEPTGEAEFYLWREGRVGVAEWTEWDLTSLGKVARVDFNLVGSPDLYTEYGLGVAGYFAYDDVKVIFE